MGEARGKGSTDWAIDEACGTLTLGEQTTALRVRARLVDEDFRSHTPAREFVPLTVTQGRRTVVTAHFYTVEPDLMPVGLRPPRIGDGEAYFYHADAIVLLWRCNLLARYRAAEPVADRALHVLWDRFEALLRHQFPQAGQMMIPAWNRPYDQALWRAFVRARGFTRRSPVGLPGRALIKDRPASP